jgi:hypothetical protein
MCVSEHSFNIASTKAANGHSPETLMNQCNLLKVNTAKIIYNFFPTCYNIELIERKNGFAMNYIFQLKRCLSFKKVWRFATAEGSLAKTS